jgi:phosphoketolase
MSLRNCSISLESVFPVGQTAAVAFCVHLNCVIKAYVLNMIDVSGRDHGGTAVVGNAYLKGTHSDVYPEISGEDIGMKTLFRPLSLPEDAQ